MCRSLLRCVGLFYWCFLRCVSLFWDVLVFLYRCLFRCVQPRDVLTSSGTKASRLQQCFFGQVWTSFNLRLQGTPMIVKSTWKSTVTRNEHIHKIRWSKETPPPGGFPIYYVPWSRTRWKRTPLEAPGTNSSREVLFLRVLDQWR